MSLFEGKCEAISENVVEDAKALRMQMVIPWINNVIQQGKEPKGAYDR